MIQIGDMVYMYRGAECGCRRPMLGVPFKVMQFTAPQKIWCWHYHGEGKCVGALGDSASTLTFPIPVTWLKKIKPLEELDKIEREAIIDTPTRIPERV